MKIKKYKKYFLFTLLFVTIIFLTFHTIFKHNNLEDIINNVSNINPSYTVICMLLLVAYFLLQGIYMKRNLKILNKDITLKQGMFYSIVEFFFSSITPSSTGGQPVQLYYMNKDKIENKKSLITLLINTIYFKLIIVIFGIGIFIFKHSMLLKLSSVFIFFYFLGIIVDIFMVIGGYLLLYRQNILKKILTTIEKILKKIYKSYEMKIDDKIEVYSKEVQNLSKYKLELFFEFVLTLIQRISLFSISYVVYKSFGLNEYDFLQLVIIQIAVQTAIECVPLPRRNRS